MWDWLVGFGVGGMGRGVEEGKKRVEWERGGGGGG